MKVLVTGGAVFIGSTVVGQATKFLNGNFI